MQRSGQAADREDSERQAGSKRQAANGQCIGSPGEPEYRGTRIQGNQNTGEPEYRGTRIQGNQNTGEPEYRGTRIQGNRSECQPGQNKTSR